MLGKPCLGFSVLAWLPASAGWLELQDELARRIPVPLALTESSLLHVSVQLLTPVRDLRTDKEQAWQRMQGDVLRTLEDCTALPSFTLAFDELRILERAIILVARECETLQTIRARRMSPT